MESELKKEQIAFYWNHKYQRDSNFTLTNNFFILAETLIIFTYVTSFSTGNSIIFKPLLVAGISISFLWLLMNLEFYIIGIRLEQDYYEVVTENGRVHMIKWKKPAYRDLLPRLSFWTFLGIPVFFFSFQMILFFS